jgi:sulfur-carrier protein adenylyltransferase/sulfurtransferase
MKSLYKLATVLIPLGVLIAAIPANKVVVEKANPAQLLAEVKDASYLLSTDVVADMLVKKDPSLQLIDVRSQAEFDQFHLPGAVNVPLDNILSEENSALFDQDVKMNVLYANGTTAASEAWMLLRQQGYKSLYVMQGGMNYWAETIMNPAQPSASAPDDELAKYDFRKAAGGVLGGGGTTAPAAAGVSAPAPSAPKAGAAPKKKRAAGGC